MKKVISILASILCISTAWAQTTGAGAIKRMNPYTCQLSHAVSADGKSITFSYYLNATATSIDVMVDKDGDDVFEDDEVAYTITGQANATKLTRSNDQILSVTIPFTDFNAQIPRGKGYKWALRANRAAYTSATHAWPTDWARMVFNRPGGVAVNNNPENDYFGTIYVTEGVHGTGLKYIVNGKEETHTKDEGLYIYKSDLTQYKWYQNNKSSTCFTGAANTNYGTINWGGSNEDYAPDRVCVGADGIAYINDNRQPGNIPDGHKNNVIWRAHPNTTLVQQKNSLANVVTKGELRNPSSYAHQRATSMAVVGEGDNQKIYVMNAYKLKTTDGVQFYPQLERYKLKDQTPTFEKAWVMRNESEGSDLTYNRKTYTIANFQTMLVPGVHNDMWIAQRRVSNDRVPSLVHVKFSETNGNTLTCDYVIANGVNDDDLSIEPDNGAPCPFGAIALNTDGTMLALASHGYINVFDVEYSSNHTPTLTKNNNKSISLDSEISCNALAFDKANNLYAVSQDKHRFMIYAMPGQASTTIPEQKAKTINIPHVITYHPTPTTANEVLKYPSYTPPTVSRAGYVFAGWYFGDANSYNINTPYDPSLKNKSGHLHVWARWIKATFEEGYVEATIEDGFSQQEINELSGKGVNRNEELSWLLQNSSYLPNNSLQVNRKLQGGMYNTFMLPFALTSDLRASIKDSKGYSLPEDGILTMQSVESQTANGETLYELVFAPAPASGVPAYQPFLIKPTNDLTATMTFPNVSAVEALPVQPAAEIEGVSFVPVFEPTTIGGEESNILILVANNRLAQLRGESEMLGLRGYFAGDITSSASYVMKIVDKAGVVTYIGDATAPQKGSVATKLLHNGQIYILRGDKVYTITGAKVK